MIIKLETFKDDVAIFEKELGVKLPNQEYLAQQVVKDSRLDHLCLALGRRHKNSHGVQIRREVSGRTGVRNMLPSALGAQSNLQTSEDGLKFCL